MAGITAAHLKPFADAFSLALREGRITVGEAREFCTQTYDATLSQMVQERRKNNPRGNHGGQQTSDEGDMG